MSAPALGDGAAPIGKVDKMACLNAVSKGQRLRDSHKLVEAREEFRVCARAECPGVVQSDCANWLADIEKTLPTVVFSAKDAAGKDVVDVRVSVDGVLVASALDGQAVAVDPGLRTFRFERPDGSFAAQQMLVKEGGKAQNVTVSFEATPAPGGAVMLSPSSSTSPSTQAAETSPPGRGRWVLGIVLGSAGVLAMGAGVGIALNAKSRDSDAEREAGSARQTDSASAVSEGNVATVVLGVGAAVAVAGAVLWLTAPSAKAAVGTTGRDLFLRGSF